MQRNCFWNLHFISYIFKRCTVFTKQAWPEVSVAENEQRKVEIRQVKRRRKWEDMGSKITTTTTKKAHTQNPWGSFFFKWPGPMTHYTTGKDLIIIPSMQRTFLPLKGKWWVTTWKDHFPDTSGWPNPIFTRTFRMHGHSKDMKITDGSMRCIAELING